MELTEIQKLCEVRKIKWSTHCLERMQERDILRSDVINCISHGELIEDYPEDYPHPSCLIFGITLNNEVIHIVVGNDNEHIYIITAYRPNTIKFKEDLKTRKEK